MRIWFSKYREYNLSGVRFRNLEIFINYLKITKVNILSNNWYTSSLETDGRILYSTYSMKKLFKTQSIDQLNVILIFSTLKTRLIVNLFRKVRII